MGGDALGLRAGTVANRAPCPCGPSRPRPPANIFPRQYPMPITHNTHTRARMHTPFFAFPSSSLLSLLLFAFPSSLRRRRLDEAEAGLAAAAKELAAAIEERDKARMGRRGEGGPTALFLAENELLQARPRPPRPRPHTHTARPPARRPTPAPPTYPAPLRPDPARDTGALS